LALGTVELWNLCATVIDPGTLLAGKPFAGGDCRSPLPRNRSRNSGDPREIKGGWAELKRLPEVFGGLKQGKMKACARTSPKFGV